MLSGKHVGILTFINANNYGAVLQAYSLQKKLEEMGADCELIDYRCPAIEEMHRLRTLSLHNSFKKNIANIRFNLYQAPRRKAFIRFKSTMKISPNYTLDSISETNSKYDLFLTGSDQVFNLSLTKGDITYFLDFAEPNKKKVAFAASLGSFVEEEKTRYQKLLSSFDAISLREQSAIRLFEEKLSIKADFVPDPVFLHSKEEWINLLSLKEKQESYVLLYSLHNLPLSYEIANRIAREKGKKLFVITKSMKPAGSMNRLLKNESPKSFLEWIMNADTVITDSFHGTAFSLIFEKEFLVTLPNNYQERITDMLDDLGISQCMVNQERDIFENNIWTEEIKDRFRKYCAIGTEYLGYLDSMK